MSIREQRRKLGRRSWRSLPKERKEFWRGVVDLMPGETIIQWWEVLNDSVYEDGSWKTEGWPC